MDFAIFEKIIQKMRIGRDNAERFSKKASDSGNIGSEQYWLGRADSLRFAIVEIQHIMRARER